MYNLKNKEIAYALYGLMLGDGTINGNTIIICHTNKQRYYVKFLAKWCRENNIIFRTRYDYYKKTTFGDVLYSEIRIYIPTSIKKHFKGGRCDKKELSQYLLKRISPLGLLFWYLDDGNLCCQKRNDGNKTNRFAYLNTQCFSKEENMKIQKMLIDRFGIKTTLNKDNSGFDKCKDKTYYRLRFGATEFRKFYDLVRQYLKHLPKEFEYKFNMKYEPNRLKNSEYLSNNYNFNNLL